MSQDSNANPNTNPPNTHPTPDLNSNSTNLHANPTRNCSGFMSQDTVTVGDITVTDQTLRGGDSHPIPIGTSPKITTMTMTVTATVTETLCNQYYNRPWHYNSPEAKHIAKAHL